MEIDSGGVPIHVEVAGEGRPVVLLHGFPDSGALWRHQVPALVEAGFQVIVPDLRGFGASARRPRWRTTRSSTPSATWSPCSTTWASSGPTWWATTSARPRPGPWPPSCPTGSTTWSPCRSARPSAFRSVGVPQLEKSWYMFFFQFPGVGEQWLAADDWANFRAWSHHPDADAIVARWEATGTLTAALNWYRANIPPEGFAGPPLELPAVEAPTMGVWSTGDFALTEEQMTRLGRLRVRPVALRTDRGSRPLAAARGPRRGQRPAPRLPADLSRRAGAGVRPTPTRRPVASSG